MRAEELPGFFYSSFVCVTAEVIYRAFQLNVPSRFPRGGSTTEASVGAAGEWVRDLSRHEEPTASLAPGARDLHLTADHAPRWPGPMSTEAAASFGSGLGKGTCGWRAALTQKVF